MLPRALVSIVAVLVSASLVHAAAPGEGAPPAKKPPADAAAKQIARGRHLVKIAGCNDCHTAGYASAAGRVPQEQWLLGDTLGRRGAWGTTYPVNLRLHLARLSEQEWVEAAGKLQTRPPMPWYALREIRKPDLAAIYQFVRHLGPAGTAAPVFVPAGGEPAPPFVQYPLPPKK
jgi:hypothetical protein